MSAALPTPPATPVAATSAPTAAAPVPNAAAAAAPLPNAPAAAPAAPRRIAPLRRTNAFVNLRTLRAEPTPALTMPGAWPREKKPDPIQAAVEATQKEIRLKRKRAEEDAARDEKRRRVESDAPAPSRAEARPTARDALTGATAQTNHNSTATAATSAARNPTKIKATLSKCPPPPPLTSKAAPSTSSGASTSSSSTSTSAQLRKTALLREAPTLIDIGTIAPPASVTTLSRQPAIVFGSDATAQPSMDLPGAALPLGHMQAAGFLPAVSGSPPRRKRETPHSPPPPPRKKRRGKRSGHRSRKLDDQHGSKEGKKDGDRDGAATA